MDKYRTFLQNLQEGIQSAVAEVENAGFHHSDEGSPEWTVYNRILTWEAAIAERIRWYDDTKSAKAAR